MGIILFMISGLGGALVGAFLSGRLIAYAQSLNNQRHLREREARTLLNLFQALQAELTALWTGYTATWVVFPSGQGIFAVVFLAYSSISPGELSPAIATISSFYHHSYPVSL